MPERNPRARPNIVVIITDDQDKISLGPYGGKSYTPNIDKMAAEGIVFDRAYVNSTVCTKAEGFVMDSVFSLQIDSPFDLLKYKAMSKAVEAKKHGAT